MNGKFMLHPGCEVCLHVVDAQGEGQLIKQSCPRYAGILELRREQVTSPWSTLPILLFAWLASYPSLRGQGLSLLLRKIWRHSSIQKIRPILIRLGKKAAYSIRHITFCRSFHFPPAYYILRLEPQVGIAAFAGTGGARALFRLRISAFLRVRVAAAYVVDAHAVGVSGGACLAV